MNCFGKIYIFGDLQCRDCDDFEKCDRISQMLKKKEHYREKKRQKQEASLFNILRKKWGYPY